MPRSALGTLTKDACRRRLALIAMVAAGISLAACEADSVGGPSSVNLPATEPDDGGIDVGTPAQPCLLFWHQCR